MLCIRSAANCDDLGLAKLLLNERQVVLWWCSCSALIMELKLTNRRVLARVRPRRLCDRPQSAQSWSKYSRVFESIGDASGVRDAQSMSYVLGLGQGGNQTN